MNTIITIRSKAIVLLSAFAIVSSSAFSQSKDRNYLMEKVALDAEGKTFLKSVQYYNGLGYPTVSVGEVGGNGETAYTLTTYDGVGREECKYLPVVISANLGYKSPNEIKNASSSANDNDDTAYNRNSYDALDRVTTVDLPGKAWRDNKRQNTIAYSANKDKEVKLYVVSNDKLIQDSRLYYPANSLTKETAKDPDGNTVVTFKDFSGNVVLQRANDGKKNLDTYYVYDYLGHLRFVLPPKCTSESDIAVTGYQYKYDKRGRMTIKILPGCNSDSIRYWYDNRDRMISMRDPRLRNAGKYRFFIYDNLNRLVVQGVCTSCPKTATVRNATFSKTADGVLGTSYVMPTEYVNALKNAELEIANYYDKNQDNIKGSLSKYFSDIKITTSVSQQGQLTGSVVAASNGEFIAQLMIYDLKGNLTNSRTKEIGGRSTSNATEYTFTNNVSFSETYIAANPGLLKVTENIGYNTYNNKKSSYALTLNYGTSASASISYAYDELGRLSTVTRPLPSSVNRNIKYAYDMHGWLTGITTNSFTEELFYASGYGTKCYNGNISSLKWKDNNSSKMRGYKFEYDRANRMLKGIYGEGDELTANANGYTENMTYDENGNILTVKRYGRLSSGKYGLMDNLSITYKGNQLSTVSESVADNNQAGSFEYQKGKISGSQTQYKYNTSGSLLADKSRGIAYITYDLNNNPEKIYFTNGSVTKYVYSASGQKLRAVHYTAKPNITRTWGTKPAELTAAQILQTDSTDYLLGGSLVMKDGKIDKFLFEGGYAQATSASKTTDKFAFYYYNQDHLGNNREVVDAKGVVQQVTNYYPFGAPYADATASKGADLQPYKYNGKELDLMHGLNTYDYGARQHDPILARWDRIDRFCEKYYNVSPYAYCANNPVRFVDIHGDSIYIENGKERVLYTEGMKYEGKNKYVSQAISALNTIMKYGKSTLMSLMNSEHSFNIKKTSTDNLFKPEDSNAAQSVTFNYSDSPWGCGGDVFWNPKNETSGPDIDGKNKRPSWIGLAHEIGHADAADKGIANYTNYAPKSAWKQVRSITYDEFHAIQYENLVRKNAEFPIRVAYSTVPQNIEYGRLIHFMPIH